MQLQISRLSLFTLAINLALVAECPSADRPSEQREVLSPTRDLGAHFSIGKQFRAILRQNAMGGGIDLFVLKGDEPLFFAADVNSIVWSGDRLIFAAGPLYGPSGIFRYEAALEQISVVRAGDHNDYFELRALNLREKKLEFYYAADIEHLDVSELRANPEAVQSIDLSELEGKARKVKPERPK
jgi:hypothetical protein